MATIFKLLSKVILILALAIVGVLSYCGIGAILTTIAVLVVISASVGCEYLADRYSNNGRVINER